MKIANLYSHLNGYEFLLVHKKALWDEIEAAIARIDANQFIKTSRAKPTIGKQLYDQKKLNKCFEKYLFPLQWQSVTTPYYVTGDIQTEREIVGIRDWAEQRRIIESKGQSAFSTNNQVDFVKDRVAVEVQFGKYFSVAYDLHVKHTFFFLRNDIDVGIEIIPKVKWKPWSSLLMWIGSKIVTYADNAAGGVTVTIGATAA